jgi:hypothetical protein
MSENHNDYWDEKNLDGHDENGVGYRLDKYGRKCYKPTERWVPPAHEVKFKPPRRPQNFGEDSNPEDEKGK